MRLERARRRALALLVVAGSMLFACGRWAPPVAVGQRDSLAGQGVVLTLTNTSDRYLHEVTVTITPPDGDERSAVIETLGPHASESVGWLRLEGWPIPAGAEVEVRALDYRGAVRHQT